MEKLCPISNHLINEKVARLNATLTSILLALTLVAESKLLAIFLVVDFFTRGFIDGKYSLLSMLSSKLVSLFKLSPKTINAGQKIFAAQVGFFFSLVVLLGLIFTAPLLSNVAGGIFLICTILEALFGFCVACKIYPIIRKRE